MRILGLLVRFQYDLSSMGDSARLKMGQEAAGALELCTMWQLADVSQQLCEWVQPACTLCASVGPAGLIPVWFSMCAVPSMRIGQVLLQQSLEHAFGTEAFCPYATAGQYCKEMKVFLARCLKGMRAWCHVSKCLAHSKIIFLSGTRMELGLELYARKPNKDLAGHVTTTRHEQLLVFPTPRDSSNRRY